MVSTDGEGLAFALRRCTQQVCTGTYFDGSRLYSLDMNDTVLPQSTQTEPYLRALRQIACVCFLAPAYAQSGGHLYEGDDATIAGKRYASLFIASTQDVPLHIFVDPQTALIRYVRDVHGDDTFEYRDYRRVEGFAIPFEIMHNGQVLEKYDDRTPVATAFHAPRGLQPAFAGPAAPIATDTAHVTPVFGCTIAKTPVKCLLDSGNSGMSISSELAARLEAPVVGTFSVLGLGGYTTQVVRAGPLQVGNATYPEANYIVLNDVSKYGYDVVLGTDVLASTTIEIDVKNHTIALDAPKTGGSINVPMAFENFVPVVNVELGAVGAKLAIDTGDESNINLAYDFYSKHPTLFNVTGTRNVGGVGGNSVQVIGEIPSITVGDYRTGPQKIGATKDLQGTAFGHLGAAFLEQFKVQLDYVAGELHLTPEP